MRNSKCFAFLRHSTTDRQPQSHQNPFSLDSSVEDSSCVFFYLSHSSIWFLCPLASLSALALLVARRLTVRALVPSQYFLHQRKKKNEGKKRLKHQFLVTRHINPRDITTHTHIRTHRHIRIRASLETSSCDAETQAQDVCWWKWNMEWKWTWRWTQPTPKRGQKQSTSTKARKARKERKGFSSPSSSRSQMASHVYLLMTSILVLETMLLPMFSLLNHLFFSLLHRCFAHIDVDIEHRVCCVFSRCSIFDNTKYKKKEKKGRWADVCWLFLEFLTESCSLKVGCNQACGCVHLYTLAHKHSVGFITLFLLPFEY